MEKSKFEKIEKKWQNNWEKSKIFQVKENHKKPKYFCLEFFPYPSSFALHMGHLRNYTIGDVIARYKRMNGFNVLYPMGYDSFGLPAENAAKKEGIHPKKYTESAIKKIMEYQKALGNSYDWSRKISTHEPEYYKWNQYFFLKFLENGLVYRKKAPVNWCLSCNSTLANEEVVSGKCWRHEDTEVIQKELEQWFLKTTAYAEELLNDIDKLEWSDRIKTLQRNWIGKSEGLLIDFAIKNSKKKIQVFTTRADTIFGVTFLVVSPKHNLINELAKENKKQVEELSRKVQNEEEKDKEGVFLGSYAINPMTKEEVPIYAANFVVAEYGTGAVMAVPAHDKRDFEFAKKYNINTKIVIVPESGAQFKAISGAYVDEGILINSEKFDKMKSRTAIKVISDYIEKNKLGRKITQYKLRDWLISRQRYWGTPIPIVYCKKCGAVPIKEKDLPVLLPEKADFKVEGNPLQHVKEWTDVKCPSCKSKARRETDTMGGFVDSSWYFLRFCSPANKKSAFDKNEVKYWMPVDQYIGGIEHAVGHLIYSRFFTKALRDLKMLNFDEPFTKLYNQGILYKDRHKMSKSFGNIVTQTEISDKYGIDTARVFLMSVASPDSDMEWSDKGVEGSFKFLQKVLRLSELKFRKENEKDEHKRNLTIKNYTKLVEEIKFNLAIIELIKFTDYLAENPNKKGYEDLLKILSPFAPHICEELWNKLGKKSFVSIEKWPEYDEKKINKQIEEQEKNVDKLIEDINNVVNIIKEKGKEASKVFVYVLPKEKEIYSNEVEAVKKRTNLDVKVYAVNDKNKYDPSNKSSKAKPGKPAIYLE
ncbi:leucine--tRNA ligase [Candidatus Woesearchaeota archaeon]|nr:leucine--tRNA ligase [Candidatus Woesearchaeota archaeon]